MHELPDIVVIDEDGELDDVRAILDELGEDFTSLHTKSGEPGMGEPRRMLVASAAAAVSRGFTRTVRGAGSPTWMAVTRHGSRTQRNLLLQTGFDYLVRRPVHPSALRLLLQRALFRGEDQRRGLRVAVGYGVGFRQGIWRRAGTLVDLSAGGARLLANHEIEPGTRLVLQVPGEIDGGTPFRVAARVLRQRPAHAEGGDEGEFSLALGFAKVDRATRTRICEMVDALMSGPASLAGARMARRDDAAETPARARRSAYSQEVVVFGSAQTVLMGCDLAEGGMRVEQHPGLAVGDLVRLALPAGGRSEPVIVKARVARDDGPRGLGLVFESVGDTERAQLASMVECHPAIEALGPAAVGSSGVIVSRIVPTLQRVADESKSWLERFRSR